MERVKHGIRALVQTGQGTWLQFQDPVEVVEARDPRDVPSALAEVETVTRARGLEAVGFVAYEAGAAFGLSVCLPTKQPLVWFGLFDPLGVVRLADLPRSGAYQVRDVKPSLDRAEFDAAVAHVKSRLLDGDTYQVNYTFRMHGKFEGDPQGLFTDLVAAQQGRHCAFLSLGSWAVCSASPELFVAREGSRLEARPMKGTVRRGRTTAEDVSQRNALRGSPKQQAENVMIVDMVRNDLGRIAEVGSVEVPELFTVERYPNVWQMTSLVTARSSAALVDIFRAMHPSASVTGAPKVKTMEILRELEGRPRGVYTGAVGHVAADGSAHFSVAIRTAIVDSEAGVVEFGIGSGIVWDSSAAEEYEECLLKGSVFSARAPSFELLETLRWTPEGGFLLLGRHLERLRDSADYFGFSYHEDQVRAALDGPVASGNESLRVRLLLAQNGTVRAEHVGLRSSDAPLRVCLATEPIDSSDVFLFHKTTNRDMYNRRRVPDCDETILWNQAREVTEAITANVVIEREGLLVTPPVACGLLAGTYRAELLHRGTLREAVVTTEELASSRFWLINSVHEWRAAVLEKVC